MGLSVIARFSTLTEAQVACGALRSAGFHAEVFDQSFGTMVWTDQVAIGGFRVVAPEGELADAVAYLKQAENEAPEPESSASRGDGPWGAAAAASALTVGVDFSWLLLGVRNRLKRGGALSILELLFTAAAMVVMLVFAGAIIALVIAFTGGWLVHPPA